jgi:hypothetical protein
MSNEEDYRDVEDEVEEYEIGNLLSYFKKNNINVNGIFTHEGRTVFLFIQYQNSGLDLFIYIPSKYYIKPDNSVKNYFLINMKSEEEEEGTSSMFSNGRKNIVKVSTENSLTRFVPVFQDSIYKLVYINKELLSYINRYDGVDTFTFSSPFNKDGYYFMTDLENFYKEGTNLEKNLMNNETLLYTKVYSTFDNELPKLYSTLTSISVDSKKFSGKTENQTYISRLKRISDIMVKNKMEGKGINDCLNLISTVRSGNIKSMFYMEKIIQFLKEINEMK